MTLDELKTEYKSSYEFEKRTGISHVSFLSWFGYGYVPIKSQMKIERLTNGKLKASLTDVPQE